MANLIDLGKLIVIVVGVTPTSYFVTYFTGN